MCADPNPAKQSIYGLTRTDLRSACADLNLPSYRSDQVWRWLYVQRVSEWSEMKNVPASVRNSLSDQFSLRNVDVSGTDGKEGSTRKLLLTLRDGQSVETVLIPAVGRQTVCVSIQVGCRYQCTFCASGQGGYVRDLDVSEIVQQILVAGERGGERVTHVVFMGIGEPFDNYDAVLKAVRIINDGDGLAVGARRITISTCGVIPGIERLAEEGIQVELSVSLHSPDSECRSSLMPVNLKYPLPDLVEACRDYVLKTNRIVTFEYTLVRGVNDGREHALGLAVLLEGLSCRVNLIPLSAVPEYEGKPAPVEVINRFVKILRDRGINTTVRASKGGNIRASCGQLRARRAG